MSAKNSMDIYRNKVQYIPFRYCIVKDNTIHNFLKGLSLGDTVTVEYCATVTVHIQYTPVKYCFRLSFLISQSRVH